MTVSAPVVAVPMLVTVIVCIDVSPSRVWLNMSAVGLLMICACVIAKPVSAAETLPPGDAPTSRLAILAIDETMTGEKRTWMVQLAPGPRAAVQPPFGGF